MPTLKPATLLPVLRVNFSQQRGYYSLDNESADVEFGRVGSREIAHGIAHACNAYPRLVAALQATVELGQLCADNCADRVRDVDFDNARALLRSLGEE